MKNYLVVFSEKGVRIEKDPTFIELHKNDENVLLNPEIPHGIPLDYWIKKDNKIAFTDDCPYEHKTFNTLFELQDKIEVLESDIENLNFHNLILKKHIKYFKITTAILFIIGIISNVIR